MLPQANPALLGGGWAQAVTEGCTWRFGLWNLLDNDGNPIDFTSATGACDIFDGTTNVLSLTFAGSSGALAFSSTSTAAAGLSNSIKGGRKCTWRASASLAGSKIELWGVSNSPFVILPGTGVA